MLPKTPKMSPKGGEWDDEDDEKQARNSVDPARDDSSLSSMAAVPPSPRQVREHVKWLPIRGNLIDHGPESGLDSLLEGVA